MTALNFPDAPTTNQVFQNWMWDGTKWVPTTTGGSGIASGTVMLFFMAAAPAGWTQVTSQNDKLLRAVSGSGGVAGGTNPFSTVNAQTVTGGHSIALADLPTLTAYGTGNYYWPLSTGSWAQLNVSGGSGYYTTYSSGSQTYTNYTNVPGVGGGNHTHPITMGIQYCDMIIASKN